MQCTILIVGIQLTTIGSKEINEGKRKNPIADLNYSYIKTLSLNAVYNSKEYERA